ncbi:MAG: radical SAM protein [Polyangiaceae bacterium]
MHFPWCLQKCPYCDFVSFATEREAIDHARYADAVLAEIETRRAELARRPIGTVFIGGGTPSLWEAGEMGRVIARLREVAELASDVEVTAECNPSSLDEGRARAMGAVGVNRLRVGVQGLKRERLSFLGRLHDEEGAAGGAGGAGVGGRAGERGCDLRRGAGARRARRRRRARWGEWRTRG